MIIKFTFKSLLFPYPFDWSVASPTSYDHNNHNSCAGDHNSNSAYPYYYCNFSGICKWKIIVIILKTLTMLRT